MHKLVGLQLFWSGTPTFSSGTPTICQMGVLNSIFQTPSESSESLLYISQMRVSKLYNLSTAILITGQGTSMKTKWASGSAVRSES